MEHALDEGTTSSAQTLIATANRRRLIVGVALYAALLGAALWALVTVDYASISTLQRVLLIVCFIGVPALGILGLTRALGMRQEVRVSPHALRLHWAKFGSLSLTVEQRSEVVVWDELRSISVLERGSSQSSPGALVFITNDERSFVLPRNSVRPWGGHLLDTITDYLGQRELAPDAIDAQDQPARADVLAEQFDTPKVIERRSERGLRLTLAVSGLTAAAAAVATWVLNQDIGRFVFTPIFVFFGCALIWQSIRPTGPDRITVGPDGIDLADEDGDPNFIRWNEFAYARPHHHEASAGPTGLCFVRRDGTRIVVRGRYEDAQALLRRAPDSHARGIDSTVPM